MSNYLVNLIGMGLGFIVIPFLVKKLGRDAFGLIMLAESTIMFFEIVTVSIRVALSRHATFSLSQGRKEEFIDYLATGRVILGISALAVFLGGLCLSYNFPNIFRVPAAYVLQSKILFFLITVAFSINVLNTVFWSALYATQRYDIINVSFAIGRILRAVLILILFSMLPNKYISLISYGFIYLAMVGMQNYLVYWWHKRLIPGIRISIRRFKRDKVKPILSFGAHSSLTRISGLLYRNTAQILINIFWGPGFNAIYAVSLKLPQVMRRLFVETAWILTPTFTNLYAKKDKNKFELLFFMYSKMIAIITMPLSFMLIFMAGPIISWWVGEEFVLSAKILPIHILPLLVTIPLAASGCINNAYAKVKIPSRVNLASAILNVVLIIILAKVFALGLFGIAIAAATSSVLSAALFRSYYACKISDISLKKYWIESFVKPITWAGLIIGGCFWLIGAVQAGFKPTLFMVFTLVPALFIYYIGAYKFILNSIEKKHIKEVFELLLTKPRTMWMANNAA